MHDQTPCSINTLLRTNYTYDDLVLAAEVFGDFDAASNFSFYFFELLTSLKSLHAGWIQVFERTITCDKLQDAVIWSWVDSVGDQLSGCCATNCLRAVSMLKIACLCSFHLVHTPQS